MRPMAHLHRLATHLARASDPETWRLEHTELGIKIVRRRRILFRDMDALADMLTALQHRNGTGFSIAPAGGNTTFSSDTDDVASKIAHLAAPGARSELRMHGQRADTPFVEIDPTTTARPQWDLTISTQRRGRTTALEVWQIGKSARDFASSLAAIVDAHTVPAPRSLRDGAPLVEPISLETAAQHAHDRDLNWSSTRRGALWGAVVALVGTGLIQVVLALIQADSA